MVKLLSEDVIRHALDTGWLSCEDLHDHGCLQAAFLRFLLISSKIYKYYIPFHLIPFLLFKLKRLKKQPAKTVLMALLHYVKSIVFMAGYNTILKWWLCKNTHIFGKMTSTGPSFGAFLSAWSCFFGTWRQKNGNLPVHLTTILGNAVELFDSQKIGQTHLGRREFAFWSGYGYDSLLL